MDDKKCKQPACNCTAPEGESYCSARCSDAADATELTCQCGHPGCQGEALKHSRRVGAGAR
jgi:metallothionein